MADAKDRPIAPHLVEYENDENASQRGYIKGTDYSIPYASNWSRIHDSEVREGLLRHMNCGFFSSPGRPPTLLALKQHAQSLCILIQALNPTLKSNEILAGDPTTTNVNAFAGGGNRNIPEDPQTLKYLRNDAFDFLNDLSTPYYNDDPNHHKPLTGLMNEVRGRHEGYGTDYHCPLIGQASPRSRDEPIRPYASHHNLVMHANSCLERLDHEFSPVGGLMGLLPTSAEHEEEDLASARASLLGQWLLFTQHLVGRMHELERSYGNALDALAGEAAIPHQYLAGLGPDVRAKGRDIVFPQDRWILVNAGDDVFNHVHDLLERREEVFKAKEDVWKRNGVKGGEGEREKGLVFVDLRTRYYRIAGQGRNTLFVLPGGVGQHPGTGYMREIEGKPTVVSSVQPIWPKRVSELEKKYKGQFERVNEVENENRVLREQAQRNWEEVRALRADKEMLVQTRETLLMAVNNGKEGVEEEGMTKVLREVQRMKEKAEKAERNIEKLKRQRESAIAEIERLRIEVEGVGDDGEGK